MLKKYVQEAYDLVLNNYGPDRYQGSVHIEVLDTLNAVCYCIGSGENYTFLSKINEKYIKGDHTFFSRHFPKLILKILS